MTDSESTGSNDTESMDTYSLDDEDQLQAEDTLDDRGVDDVLDEGYSPPVRPRGATAKGESIEQRLAQEEPDPAIAVEDPFADQDMAGDDYPDAIAQEDDFLGEGEVGDRRSGRLMAPDQGARGDTESDMVAFDAGIDGGGSSAEEAAMHIIDDEPR